jgi:hypothetical protein
MTTARCLALCPLIALTTGCGWSGPKDYHLDHTSFSTQRLSQAEHETGIIMPKGARGLNLFCDNTSGWTPGYLAKIEIPTTESQAFAQQLKKLPQSETSVSSGMPAKVTWWNPTSHKVILQNFVPKPSEQFVHFYLCEEGGQSMLYLMWR